MRLAEFKISSRMQTFILLYTAIPLSPLHPTEVLEYFVTDSKSNLIVSTPAFEKKLRPLAEKVNKRLLIIDQQDLFTQQANELDVKLPKTDSKFSALMLYTSGTTNKPKGVVISYDNIEAQIASLAHAWQIKDSDVILHSLPLHHVHGVINALLLPLHVGGKVIMLPKFETEALWMHLLNIGLPQKDRVSVFMGVPTIYSYLIAEYDKLFKSKQQMAEHIKNHCSSKIRLMISGSAPLPQTVHKRWQAISGHRLLERYGMSEIGMAISNPLVEGPMKKRLANHVGQPLPGVAIRITQNSRVVLEARGEYNKGFWSENPDEAPADPQMTTDALDENGMTIGNLEVKGDNVFQEYFNKPEETKKEFTSDGWFKTGDCVAYDSTTKSFKIMGRDSVDIIKCGGYKLSALHIETIMLEHPKIKDVAVIGVPDETHGQKPVALIVYADEAVLDDAELQKATVESVKQWNEKKLPSYSLPSVIFRRSIARNHMGKVNKGEILKLFLSENIDTRNVEANKEK